MHKLYAEGLMEQEAFTITGEEVTTKEQGDVYGSLGCGSAPFVMAGKDISYDANWLGLSGSYLRCSFRAGNQYCKPGSERYYGCGQCQYPVSGSNGPFPGLFLH